MSRRYARRNDPVVPKVHRVELDEGNLLLRLLGVGIAIAVAVAAFGYLVNSMLTGDIGWQEISVSRSETGISTQFVLMYDIGASDTAVIAERKAVSLAYGDTADEAYRVMSNLDFEHYQNVAYLNAHPNEDVKVDPLLYGAFRQIEESDSRYIYFAPLFGMYNSLFASRTDEDAMKFDPEFDDGARTFAQEIAAYANDPASVQISLLGDNTVRLNVTDDYLSYAEENEIDSFVDFGILLNAFITDAIADNLISQGLTNGMISSYDGYSRTLGDLPYSLNVYTPEQGGKQTAVVTYDRAMALVTLRSFPVKSMDTSGYFTYTDGTVRAPYIGDDGMLRCAADYFAVFSQQGGCAAAALRALPAFTSDRFSPNALSGMSWVLCNGSEVDYAGSDIQLSVIE